MARYTGPSCKLCRREGTKLFLKGNRCLGPKCAQTKRPTPPGQHGQRRQKFSEYNTQLREKQKMKRLYGMLEKQFRIYYHKASSKKGVAGNNFIMMLESRLDNLVYKAGFAHSRKQARQMITHGHILVNKSKVNIPSYLVSTDDVIEPKEKSRQLVKLMLGNRSVMLPDWLSQDESTLETVYTVVPQREEIDIPVQEHFVIELYSK